MVSESISQSLGTNPPRPSTASTTGCRAARMERVRLESTRGRTKRCVSAVSASASSVSSLARARLDCLMAGMVNRDAVEQLGEDPRLDLQDFLVGAQHPGLVVLQLRG